MKISGDSIIQVRQKATRNPDIILGSTRADSLAHKHSPLGSSKERLSCVTSGQGVEEQLPQSLYQALLQCSLQMSTIFPVLSPPWAWLDLNLHWPGDRTPPCDSMRPYSPQLANCLVAISGDYWATIPTPQSQQEVLSAEIKMPLLRYIGKHFGWQATSPGYSDSVS